MDRIYNFKQGVLQYLHKDRFGQIREWLGKNKIAYTRDLVQIRELVEKNGRFRIQT